MGYTHYWRTAEKKMDHEVWREICEDARKILGDKPTNIIAWDSEFPAKAPEIDDSVLGEIRFNGIGEDGHETFCFEFNGPKFAFCKTAFKPYDVFVTAILAMIKDRAPDDVSVSSDGDPSEWEEGVALASEKLGRKIANPITE